MASDHSVEKILIPPSHLPTVMLAVGYAAYWLELYVFRIPGGMTSPLATVIFLLIGIFCFLKQRGQMQTTFRDFAGQFFAVTLLEKIYILAGIGMGIVILGSAFYAACLPPHLSQEYDALNYHIAIPRQHLILHSFGFIRWASADLFLLPVDFALAPYWFITAFPNKIPQFVFLLGLLGVAAGLVAKVTRDKNNLSMTILVLFMILGSHGIGIQMGSAMLDIVLCYLFLAALDSFFRNRPALVLIEATFFFWSKPFIPLQMGLIGLGMGIIWIASRKWRRAVQWGFDQEGDSAVGRDGDGKNDFRKACGGFIVLSVLIAGPFMTKSICYASTPLFPFAPGILKINPTLDYHSKTWESILLSCKIHMGVRDAYGYGHSGLNLLKHFWLLAVPDNNVNNKFDYPLGLPYLLCLGPFIYFLVNGFKGRKFMILPVFVVVYWGAWWLGSLQARFLYIPLVMMFILIAGVAKTPSRALMAGLLVALAFNVLSIVRAHKKDFGLAYIDVLRPEDREIVKMNAQYRQTGRTDAVELDHADAAFAQFPVVVIKENPPWALAVK